MDNRKHLTEEQIAIFAEALASGHESDLPAEWREHVAQCDQCAHEVSMVSNLIDTKSDFSGVEAGKKKMFLTSGKFMKRLAVAASIIIIVGAGIYLTTTLKDHPQQNMALLEEKPVKDSTNKKQEKQDFPETSIPEIKTTVEKPDSQIKPKASPRPQVKAETRDKLAYVPDENLEKLAERFESASMRGDDVSVVSPHEIKAEPKSDILIELKNPENSSLILEFFNNKGEKLFEKETSRETCQIKNLTEPGLYYWKLLSQDFDLLYCGKIVVEE
jgi:hypothetical protein